MRAKLLSSLNLDSRLIIDIHSDADCSRGYYAVAMCQVLRSSHLGRSCTTTAAAASPVSHGSRRVGSCPMLMRSCEDDDEDARSAAVAAACAQVDVEKLPPRIYNPAERRPRWNSRHVTPMSPHQLIDGRILRSSLLLNRKRKKKRALRFPDNEVAGCLEPENPWKHRQYLNRDVALAAYREACGRHKVSPLSGVMFQVKSTNNIDDRCEELDFRGMSLHQNDCEALEEIFRRILFYKVNLDGAIADDNSAEVLFQVFEFYEATAHLDLSNNKMIGTFGWQACSRMLRKTSSLKRLDAVNVHLTEEYMIILSRGLRYAYLFVLRLDSCRLSGRLLELLVIALKFNMALRQLYLCGNKLCGGDCLQIQTLLKFNCRLSYLDLSDNMIADDGIYYVMNGLTHQLHFGKFSRSKKGLESLILWNNQLTRRSASHINAAIKGCKTMKYLNVGANRLMDDTIMDIRDSLMENKVLMKLDLRATEITCFGCSELARVLKVNSVLEKLDLRDNPIYKIGMQNLIDVVEVNKNITEINIDEKSKIKTTTRIKAKYSDMVKQLQSICERNQELMKQEELNRSESDEEDEGDEDDDIFGEDELANLEEPQEELPTEYQRYMTWKI